MTGSTKTFATTLIAALALQASAAAAQNATFCMSDGVQIKVDRFETREGKFLLYVAGGAQPLEYPSAAVKGINVACATLAGQASGPVAAAVRGPAAGGAAPAAGFGIHGSNTVGERLMPLLIEAYGVQRLGAKPTTKLGKPEEQDITMAGAAGQQVIQLHAHGSGTSAKSLLSGAAVIGMSSRRATDEETAALQAKFNLDIRSPGNEHVLALDGLAVIVHPGNPVTQLSLTQLAQIFSGQVANWSQVGGPNLSINVYRRDDKSGTFDTFNSLVLAPQKLKVAAAAKAYESSETLSDDVTRDPAAIGFIGLPYINRNKAIAVAEQCGLSTVPSRFTIKSEAYPLARRLYLYTAGAPADPMARDLLTFALSDAAQPTVQEAGFVEQTIETQSDAEQQAWVQSHLAGPASFLAADKVVPA